MSLTVNGGWLTSAVESGVFNGRGFLYFEDGDFKCTLMAASTLSMKVVMRTKQELFQTAVENAVVANPRMRLVVNGNYFDCPHRDKIAGMANTPAEPMHSTPYGRAVDPASGVVIAGIPQADGACLYLDTSKPERWFVELGEPPFICTAGIGGLVPLIIGGKPIDDTNKRYSGSKNYDDSSNTGRLAVSQSKNGRYLLAMLQPHGTSAGLKHDQLRDKLIAADMTAAVLLDGSTSVMMYFDRDWKTKQTSYKPSVTTYGLGFYYDGARATPGPRAT
jgi:hypothetical protein